VLANSQHGPVLVEFWAPWVGPSHKQRPLLLRLVDNFKGQFLLVTVNTDEQKRVAREYAVNSLPTVKIFRRGKVVQTFFGPQPESEYRHYIEKYLSRPTDIIEVEAIQSFQCGDIDDALDVLTQAVMRDPANIRLPLLMAKILLRSGRLAAAEQLLGSLPPGLSRDEEARSLGAHLRFIQLAESAPAVKELDARIDQDTNDCEARLQRSACSLTSDDYESAVGDLLAIIRCDRRYADDAAHNGLLAIFHLLGDRSELVETSRRELRKALED